MRCIHGDVVQYPLAMVMVVVDKRELVIKAGLADKLPVDVL